MEVGFIYAMSAAVTWGLVYTIDQKILYTVSPMALLFIHSVISAIIVLPFIFFNNGSIKNLALSGNLNIALILVYAILATLANFFIFAGIKNSNASTISIIEISYPFFVVAFSYPIFRSTPNIYFFIGGILIALGSIIILKLA